MAASSSFFLLLLVFGAFAYPSFRNDIPNGESVPNPEGGIWDGVGHLGAGGGGLCNSFGEDFQSQGSKWTAELCRMDSDGDGEANGVELGDPSCKWSRGAQPEFPAQSHPGIPDTPIQREC
jgi:dopamine beta-monooxygenase